MIAIDERSDEQLLQATGSDPEAYAAFYRRHGCAVLAYTLSRTGRPELAADLTSAPQRARLLNALRPRL